MFSPLYLVSVPAAVSVVAYQALFGKDDKPVLPTHNGNVDPSIKVNVNNNNPHTIVTIHDNLSAIPGGCGTPGTPKTGPTTPLRDHTKRGTNPPGSPNSKVNGNRFNDNHPALTLVTGTTTPPGLVIPALATTPTNAIETPKLLTIETPPNSPTTDTSAASRPELPTTTRRPGLSIKVNSIKAFNPLPTPPMSPPITGNTSLPTITITPPTVITTPPTATSSSLVQDLRDMGPSEFLSASIQANPHATGSTRALALASGLRLATNGSAYLAPNTKRPKPSKPTKSSRPALKPISANVLQPAPAAVELKVKSNSKPKVKSSRRLAAIAPPALPYHPSAQAADFFSPTPTVTPKPTKKVLLQTTPKAPLVVGNYNFRAGWHIRRPTKPTHMAA